MRRSDSRGLIRERRAWYHGKEEKGPTRRSSCNVCIRPTSDNSKLKDTDEVIRRGCRPPFMNGLTTGPLFYLVLVRTTTTLGFHGRYLNDIYCRCLINESVAVPGLNVGEVTISREAVVANWLCKSLYRRN